MSIREDLSSKLKKLRHTNESEHSEKSKPVTEVAEKRLQQPSKEVQSSHKGPTTSSRSGDHGKDIDFDSTAKDHQALSEKFSWLKGDKEEPTEAKANSDSNPNPNDDPKQQGYSGSSEWNPAATAEQLKKGLEQLDSAAGGRRDGKFGIDDLKAVAADPNASPELRKAAQDVLADRNLMNAIDVAAGDDVDGVFSAGDLDRVMQDSKNADRTSLIDTRRQFAQNFEALDKAQNGKTDGKVSQGDLRAILNDPNAKPEAKQLAQRLLNDRTLWNAFDVANKDSRDGIISKEDVEEVGYSATPESGTQWGDRQRAALDRALQGDGNFGDEFTGIGQTDRGNCVVTGAIKAGMDHFGNKIFTDVKPNDNGGYDITMRDGYKVSLTKEEMEAAATGAHYDGEDPESLAYAQMAYAAAAKRAYEEKADGARTFSEALLALNDGAHAKDGIHWLGLDNNYKEVPLDDLKGRDSLVIDGNGHVFYAADQNGQVMSDHWGEAHAWDPTGEFDSEDHFKPEGAYQIVG